MVTYEDWSDIDSYNTSEGNKDIINTVDEIILYMNEILGDDEQSKILLDFLNKHPETSDNIRILINIVGIKDTMLLVNSIDDIKFSDLINNVNISELILLIVENIDNAINKINKYSTEILVKHIKKGNLPWF